MNQNVRPRGPWHPDRLPMRRHERGPKPAKVTDPNTFLFDILLDGQVGKREYVIKNGPAVRGIFCWEKLRLHV